KRRMKIETIQRQYDEVISPHYDLDPHGVIGHSLDRAAEQILVQAVPLDTDAPLRVLDGGVGTGRFLGKLKGLSRRRLRAFGLDLSEKMIDIARGRIPDLVAEVDDAANLDVHFPDHSFDLACTHYLTGFIPVT